MTGEAQSAWKYADLWILYLYSFLTVLVYFLFSMENELNLWEVEIKLNELILQLCASGRKNMQDVIFPQMTILCRILGDYKSFNLENFSSPISVL